MHQYSRPSAKLFGFKCMQLVLLVMLMCCCIVMGCGFGNRGPQRAAVSGTVTVDGQTVDNGSIQFIPIEETVGPLSGAGIENGKYSVSKDKGPVVGVNRIEIRGTRKTGEKIRLFTGEVIDKYVPIVPEQYNENSTLTREVKPGGNEFDFSLTSK